MVAAVTADLDQVGPLDGGEEFDQFLPVGTRSVTVTHVARMRGDELAFKVLLAGLLQRGSDRSDRLGMPVEASSVGEWADILNSLGGARVQSIDPIDPT
jgi:hypothetical protein